MFVLIVIRRGVTIGVYVDQRKSVARNKAERINGAVLTWRNYVSHEGARSTHDDELTFEIHVGQTVTL